MSIHLGHPAGWTHAPTQARAAAAVAAPAPEKEKYQARSVAGFELVRDEFVAEYDSQVLTYRHEKTGELTNMSIAGRSRRALMLCLGCRLKPC